MPLNIKNARVERLAAEVSKITGESKTEAIGRALEERRERLALLPTGARRGADLLHFLEREIWPVLQLKKRISKAEREAILGYGKSGV